MLEADFQRCILSAFAYDRNVKLFRRNVGAVRTKRSNGKERFIRFAEPGQSDLYGIIKEHRCPFCNRARYGTHCEIEVKSEKGKPTKAQLEWIEMVNQNNGIAILVHPEPNYPIGLRERIYKMLTSKKCPICVANSRLEV